MDKVREIAVFCRTQFEGYHRWIDAPQGFEFLRDFHRHMFHVEVEVKVEALNRSVEFIDLKYRVNRFVQLRYEHARFEDSCEMIAKEILHHLSNNAYNVSFVEVSEDGENGGRIYVVEK